ncbi:MAG TPA: SIS domain-containing protein [Terriglobales bacterium]|nr:SIS domain-containing protein [Terriglobales bacterium]
MNYIAQFLEGCGRILRLLDQGSIQKLLELLVRVREEGGRLFILGVGGGAGHASHAVNDFRKIANFEAYTPTDNVSELTARINDDGWETCYADWLRSSRICAADMVLVFSVGGGDAERRISVNLVNALAYAKSVGARIGGVVGRKGGYTGKVADACVIIPVVSPEKVTAYTESLQALIWHLLISHPRLQSSSMKWESEKQQPASIPVDRVPVMRQPFSEGRRRRRDLCRELFAKR